MQNITVTIDLFWMQWWFYSMFWGVIWFQPFFRSLVTAKQYLFIITTWWYNAWKDEFLFQDSSAEQASTTHNFWVSINSCGTHLTNFCSLLMALQSQRKIIRETTKYAAKLWKESLSTTSFNSPWFMSDRGFLLDWFCRSLSPEYNVTIECRRTLSKFHIHISLTPPETSRPNANFQIGHSMLYILMHP